MLDEQEQMKSEEIISTALVWLGLVGCLHGADGSLADLTPETRKWPPITNGLVFIDSEYTPPPYVVSRIKNGIYINGRHVESPMAWPSTNASNKSALQPPAEDIPIPATITKETTQYDAAFYNYIGYKRDYLAGKFGKQKGTELLVEAYRELPCIKDAYYDTNTVGRIIVTWIAGKVDNINEFAPQLKRDNSTPEQAAKVMDDVCEMYVRDLTNGGFDMFGNTYLRGPSESSHQRILVPLSDALKSATNEQSFISMLRTNQFFSNYSENSGIFKSFFKHKEELPKWEPRIRKK